jgi:hypothetical protein
MPLADLQAAFARSLFSGDDTDLAFASGPVSAEQALRVHRNTVMGALAGALRLTYPTVDRLVGEIFFDQAAMAFVQACPPANARLSDYGAAFPEFLRSYAPAAGLPYLPDVARLDAAIDAASHGPGDDRRLSLPLDDTVSLSLPAGLRLIDLTHPADLIKDALDADDDIALGAIDLQQQRWLVIWRSHRNIIVKPLGQAAAQFLRMFLDGIPAGRAMAAAAAHTTMDAAAQQIQRDVFAASFCQIQPHTGE